MDNTTLANEMSWHVYYSDNGPAGDGDSEKTRVRECTAQIVQDHLLNHVSSAAGRTLQGQPEKGKIILENFLYDVSQASALNITLTPDLFDSYLPSRPEIRDGLRQELLDRYPEVHTLNDIDFWKEVEHVLHLKNVSYMKLRAYVLGHDFNLSHIDGPVAMPLSKYNYPQSRASKEDSYALRGLNYHLAAVPFLYTHKNIQQFFTTDGAQRTLTCDDLKRERDETLKRRERFWKKLVGTATPSPEVLKEAITGTDEFSKYIEV
ncbi:MAG: hypothetical protein ACJKTH_01475 [Patescibacteria group bacterium UBA2163]